MICLFEDRLVENFYPLGLTRHLSHLLVGTMTLRARAERALGDSTVTLHGRRHIRAYHGALGDAVTAPEETTLFLNARVPALAELIASFPTSDEWILAHGSTVVAARLGPGAISRLDWEADALELPLHGDIPVHQVEPPIAYEYLWDLLTDNGARIAADAALIARDGEEGVVMSGAHVMHRDNVILGYGSTVMPGAVIDAGPGPVIIGRGVEVMPNAVIEGPCYIGDGSRIKIGAKIYGQTSIGPSCKVGGEVENTIFIGFGNKQHDGFLGHSYLGAWVNLGADTNTSDLKNNYGTIRVKLAGREVNSGRMFLGSLIGDHAKTGINTMLNTGTVIGVAANVFGGGFPPKEIPSFAWGGADGFERFELGRAIELARTVHGRRRVPFTDADEALLRHVAESTATPGTETLNTQDV